MKVFETLAFFYLWYSCIFGEKYLLKTQVIIGEYLEITVNFLETFVDNIHMILGHKTLKINVIIGQKIGYKN